MNDRSPLVPRVSSQQVEGHVEEHADLSPGSGERPADGCPPQKAPGAASSWRTRNVLGVFNWELVLILIVALIAGVVAAIGSSIAGVR